MSISTVTLVQDYSSIYPSTFAVNALKDIARAMDVALSRVSVTDVWPADADGNSLSFRVVFKSTETDIGDRRGSKP